MNKVYVIYDENKGGYINWSSNDKADLITEFALHCYDAIFYPQQVEPIINNLRDYLDKQNISEEKGQEFVELVDLKLFKLALGEDIKNYEQQLTFIQKLGFVIDKITKEESDRVDFILGNSNQDVVSSDEMKEQD